MQTNYVPSFTKSRVLQTMIIVRLPSLWMNLKLVTLRTKATWLRMVKIISSLVWSAGNYFSNILTLRYNTARWLDIQYEGLSRRCLEINFFFPSSIHSGFYHLLLSDMFDVFNCNHQNEIHQDMNQPLSHYFIDSSHNTWVLFCNVDSF